jgi:two-component system NarL family sensor kinase
LKLTLELGYAERHPQEQLLFSAARELLANVTEHAVATTVRVQLGEVGEALALVVEDDGHGFDPELLASRLADGHVGLASQRVLIEAAGGSMSVVSGVGRGTRVEIRVPNRH